MGEKCSFLAANELGDPGAREVVCGAWDGWLCYFWSGRL